MIFKEYISWSKLDKYVDLLVNWCQPLVDEGKLGAIYGLPRGGLPIAVMLSHRLDLPLLMNYYDRKIVTDKQILVVDDIADTGHTLKDFVNEHNVIVTIHYHKQSIVTPNYFCAYKYDDWIVYPWETEHSETVQDYLKDNCITEPDGLEVGSPEDYTHWDHKHIKSKSVKKHWTKREIEQWDVMVKNAIKLALGKDPNQLNLFGE